MKEVTAMKRKRASRKLLSLIIFLTVLFCAFLNVNMQKTSVISGDSPLGHSTYTSAVTDSDFIVDTEKVSVSPVQSNLVRRSQARRSNTNLVLFFMLVPALLWGLYAYFHSERLYFSCSENYSHKFIIKYIHNSDGHKA